MVTSPSTKTHKSATWNVDAGYRKCCLTEGGGEPEVDEAREEALSAASFAVSCGLAAEDAVGAVPAVAVAADSGSPLDAAAFVVSLTVVAGSSGFTSGTGWGVFNTAS